MSSTQPTHHATQPAGLATQPALTRGFARFRPAGGAARPATLAGVIALFAAALTLPPSPATPGAPHAPTGASRTTHAAVAPAVTHADQEPSGPYGVLGSPAPSPRPSAPQQASAPQSMHSPEGLAPERPPTSPEVTAAGQARYPEPTAAQEAALERASADPDPNALLDLAQHTEHALLRIEATSRFVEHGADLSRLLPWSFERDDPLLHAFVGAVLADGGQHEAAPALERWLHDPRATVRLAAADGLLGIAARHGTPSAAAEATLRALGTTEHGQAALDCLAKHNPAAAADMLREHAAGAHDHELQLDATLPR